MEGQTGNKNRTVETYKETKQKQGWRVVRPEQMVNARRSIFFEKRGEKRHERKKYKRETTHLVL